MNYFWIRIYDFKYNDSDEYCDDNYQKGVLLDEYYLKGENLTRDEVKSQVTERSNIIKFAKPRKKNSTYAIIMDSNEFFYSRFNTTVDTTCFCCHKKISGKEMSYPYITFEDKKYYCCSYECKRKVLDSVNPYFEGEFQERKTGKGTYGYIYHIYNRKTNMHYIGQTVYMPFFRWQEHAVDHIKGDIVDLIFDTVTEVPDIGDHSQEYLNNIESWWIQKFISDHGRDHVMNITVPKLTMADLIIKYEQIVNSN